MSTSTVQILLFNMYTVSTLNFSNSKMSIRSLASAATAMNVPSLLNCCRSIAKASSFFLASSIHDHKVSFQLSSSLASTFWKIGKFKQGILRTLNISSACMYVLQLVNMRHTKAVLATESTWLSFCCFSLSTRNRFSQVIRFSLYVDDKLFFFGYFCFYCQLVSGNSKKEMTYKYLHNQVQSNSSNSNHQKSRKKKSSYRSFLNVISNRGDYEKKNFELEEFDCIYIHGITWCLNMSTFVFSYWTLPFYTPIHI